MADQSKFGSARQVDDPLIQDANYRFGAPERQYVDNQIRDIQQYLVGQFSTLVTSVSATLTVAQRYVTVTAAGQTITLPASPVDGEEHDIKGNGSFAVTLTGAGKNIDGSASYTQPTNRSNTHVRFNSTTGEWEIR